ncbi:MAG TPA: RMD1 family protein, partial [Clostridiales bacterium]|nr:RMD1 family protein [Clostridiales bacterium]
IVLINASEDMMPQLLGFIKKFEPETDLNNWNRYTDEYELRIEPEGTLEITDEYAVVPDFELFHIELAAIVIAKSVAMEKTEYELGKIFDQVESMIDRLEQGRLRVGNRELARATAQVTRHQYNTISYIMILDKPDITWSNSDASLFYEKMSDFFELNDRYTILTKKADIMNNIIGGFSSISHSIRGLFVEWVIVLLIVLEVILMIIDLVL